jgi:uncharacterized protein
MKSRRWLKFLLLSAGIVLGFSLIMRGGGAVSKGAELVEAVEKDDEATVQQLLSEGVTVDAEGANGWTALMVACAYRGAKCTVGNPTLVRTLLDAGANPNGRNFKGWTALMVACGFVGTKKEDDRDVPEYAVPGNLELIRMLLAAGASPNIVSRDGWTALLWTAALAENLTKERPLAVEIQKELIRKGADLNPTTPESRHTILDFAIRACDQDPAACDLDLVRLILERGGKAAAYKQDRVEALAARAGVKY